MAEPLSLRRWASSNQMCVYRRIGDTWMGLGPLVTLQPVRVLTDDVYSFVDRLPGGFDVRSGCTRDRELFAYDGEG